MTRIKYSREELLSLNTAACRRPLNLPKEVRVSQLPTLATLFNNRNGSCKPPEKKARHDDDLDPDSPGMIGNNLPASPLLVF